MRILADYGLIKNPSNEDKPSIYQFPSSRKQKITWATRDNTDDFPKFPKYIYVDPQIDGRLFFYPFKMFVEKLYK